MSERFLKFIPSDEALWLLKKKGHAFRLLAIIAESARRYEGDPDGLKVGECFIGGHANYDMTERNYRTAKDILVARRHVEIVETCRTRKKSTTGTTTVGTKVKLLSTTVWDINPEATDDRSDDRPTTDRRPTDDKLRKNKKEKKEKEERASPSPSSFPSLPKKIKFRELVELTQTEYDSLLAKHGQEFLDHMLNLLDSRKGSKGYKYASDYHTMKEGGWVVKETRKEILEQKQLNEKANKHSPGEQPRNVIQPSKTEFQPRRVLRGTNDAGSLDQGCANE